MKLITKDNPLRFRKSATQVTLIKRSSSCLSFVPPIALSKLFDQSSQENGFPSLFKVLQKSQTYHHGTDDKDRLNSRVSKTYRHRLYRKKSLAESPTTERLKTMKTTHRHQFERRNVNSHKKKVTRTLGISD